jgi:hypothetical protein
MKETTNNAFITGVLVKKEFEVKKVNVKDDSGNVIGQDDAISGSLVLRTTDGSEHEVNYYSRKTKKDGGQNGIFTSLQTVNNDYKSLEQFPDEADHVKIGAGQFSVNDYKGKDGEVKTYIQTKANFANRLSQKEIETTPSEAKFEIEGIVSSIKEEIYKNEPTGNYRIIVDVLGYNGSIIPVTVVVMKEMAEAFISAGFFEGGYAKFAGKLVNTKETVEIVEKMAFGEDNVRVVDKTVSRFEITGGNPLGTPVEHEIRDEEYDQAKSKRKLKLEEIKNKENKPSQSANVNNPFGNQTSNQSSSNGNPFANPFAK